MYKISLIDNEMDISTNCYAGIGRITQNFLASGQTETLVLRVALIDVN